MYALIDLATLAVGSTGSLPDELVGLDDAALADLSWVGEPLDRTYAGKGYWPLEVSDPPFDPATHTLTDELTDFTPVKTRRVVKAKRGVRPLTPEELEARKPRVPPEVALFKARFVMSVTPAPDKSGRTVLQAVEQAVEAISDPAKKALAVAALEYANTVSRHGALVTLLAPTLGLTDELLDEMFRKADAIVA